MKGIETVNTKKYQFANGDESILKEFLELSDHQEFDGRILKNDFPKEYYDQVESFKVGP